MSCSLGIAKTDEASVKPKAKERGKAMNTVYRDENVKMAEYLKNNGIDATPKYIFSGSQAGTWRLYNLKTQWFGNKALQEKLTALGFRDFDGKPLSDYSGNGGVFQIFAKQIESEV